jgi:hypothetical protein
MRSIEMRNYRLHFAPGRRFKPDASITLHPRHSLPKTLDMRA